MLAALAAAMNFRQILEEQARALEQVGNEPSWSAGNGIDAGLDIGEILPEQRGHVRVEAPAVGHGRIGVAARPRALAGSARAPLRIAGA